VKWSKTTSDLCMLLAKKAAVNLIATFVTTLTLTAWFVDGLPSG
jgi:hypothetical protein